MSLSGVVLSGVVMLAFNLRECCNHWPVCHFRISEFNTFQKMKTINNFPLGLSREKDQDPRGAIVILVRSFDCKILSS